VSGGKKKAVAMYRKMLRWRKENEIGKKGGKEGVKGVVVIGNERSGLRLPP